MPALASVFHTPARFTRRIAVRSTQPLRAHGELIRLVLLVALAFGLAFYLDARNPDLGARSASASSPSAPAIHPGERPAR